MRHAAVLFRSWRIFLVIALVVEGGLATAAPPKASAALTRKWGPAIECKAIPDLPQLPSPEAIISLDGLTLHLSDKTTGFDRVYPIGVGMIRRGTTLTSTSDAAPDGLYHANLDQPPFRDKRQPKVRWAWNYSCRFWWYDTGKRALLPVYAGLPFIRLEAPGWSKEGVHGPAENFRRPDGGTLRRGYVSHGCVRMESAGILDLYGRTRGKRFPVRVQREIERRSDGIAVDVADRWFLSECARNEDCNFAGGTCHKNPFAPHGFCTTPCNGQCADRPGYSASFCATDPDAPSQGMCTVRASSFNNQCKRFQGFVQRPSVKRFGQPSTKAAVCMPGKSLSKAKRVKSP